MTSPRPPVEGSVEHRPASGHKPGRDVTPTTKADHRGLIVVGTIGGLALIVALFALFVTATRPTPAPESACRTIAWNAVPASGSLPAGWTINGSGFYTDGYGASLSGPTPSGTPATGPAMNVRVSCYGDDGHLVVRRSHDSDLAVGGTDVPFADIGDEALATEDSTGTTTSVYIRRGPLVASIAAQGMSPDELTQAATAVDDAMVAAEAKTPQPGGSTAQPSIPAASIDQGTIPSDAPASDVPEPTPTEAHAFKDLEAILPKSVDGTALSAQSTTGTDVLVGDPSSTDLLAWITSNGKKSSDLEVAEAFDPTNSVDIDITAVKLNGVAPATLRQELLKTWLGASASGITTRTTSVGGKSVLVIDYGDQGALDYVFEQGGAVVILSSSDAALAGRVVSTFK
jgi:hypothetical protein